VTKLVYTKSSYADKTNMAGSHYQRIANTDHFN